MQIRDVDAGGSSYTGQLAGEVRDRPADDSAINTNGLYVASTASKRVKKGQNGHFWQKLAQPGDKSAFFYRKVPFWLKMTVLTV